VAKEKKKEKGDMLTKNNVTTPSTQILLKEKKEGKREETGSGKYPKQRGGVRKGEGRLTETHLLSGLTIPIMTL